MTTIQATIPNNSTPIFTDTVLIMTSKRGRATKIHKRALGGGWETQGFDKLYHFRAKEWAVPDLRAFFDVLTKSSRNPASLVVGETLIAGKDPNEIKRRIHGEEASLTPVKIGHQWICFEVDGVPNPPAFFDAANLRDRSNDAAFAQWWMREYLPEAFWDKSAILQWSSSALVKGKISFHLWMWLDRPVARASIRDFAMTHWRQRLDCTIWDGARVHYIADPIFKHVDGSKMDDPLAGTRWLWIQGAGGDAAPALPEWVDQPTWDAKIEAKRLADEAEDALRKSARAAVVAAAALARTRRVVRGKARAGEIEGAEGDGGGEAGECDRGFVSAADEAEALEWLGRYRRQIQRLTTKDAKHEDIRSISIRAARNLGGILSEAVIRGELEDVASLSLQKHGDRSRVKAVADEEVAGIFASAFVKARAKGFREVRRVSDFAAIGAGLCAAPPALDPTPEPTAETEEAGQAEGEGEAEESPIQIDEDGCVLNVKTQLEIDAEAFNTQFLDARAELAHIVANAVRTGGRHAVCAPAGLGKSHSVCETLIAHRRAMHLGPSSPTHLATPDLKLAEELRDGLRQRGANAVLAVTRTLRNCEKFAEVVLAGRLAPGGGKKLCESCDWHPKNAGSVDACPFWREYAAQEAADFVCGSHALEALKATLDETDDCEKIWPVKIDWASFSAKIDPGDAAVPVVRRTAAGITVGARFAYGDNGTVPPTPCFEDTPRWTSASKTAFIEWLATAFKCEPNRASVMEAATRGRAVKGFIDWRSIGDLAGDTANFVPSVRWEDKGFLRGYHIDVWPVKPPEAGAEQQETPTGWPLPAIEFTGTFPLTPESKAEIREWIQTAWGVENDLALDEYARSHIDEYPVDTLIVDESILHALRFGGALTRANLQELRLAGEIAGPGVEDLIVLMHKTEQARTNRDQKTPSYIASKDIGAQIRQLDVISKHESGTKRIGEALRLNDKPARIERLSGGWGWEAVEALRRVLATDWRGAYIDGGVLHVAAPRKLALGDVRSVILLDATMTPKQARAALGARVQFHPLHVGHNPHLEVIHIPVDLGPRAGAWGDKDGPRTKRSAALLAAALHKWGGEKSVTFLHKRALDPERCWVADLVAGGEFGEMTYHGAAQSRGSNRWRGCETNIMTGHYVPKCAKRQQAELLSLMCGEPYDAETAKGWDTEAAWLLEGGAQVQELARIRPLDASAKNPKRVVFLDKRAPEEFGLLTTEEIDPDLLSWRELGFLPSLVSADEGGRLRSEVMAEVAAEVVAMAGGVYPVGSDAYTVDMPHRQALEKTYMKNLLDACQYKDSDGRAETLSHRLNSWCHRHFALDWTRFAFTMRLDVTRVGLAGRPPLLVLHPREGLRLPALEAHLAYLGYYHYRVGGSGPVVSVGGFEEEDKLFQALWPLTRVDFEGQSLTGIYRTLALTAQVSARTVQSWVGARKIEGEGNRECLVRLWACVRASFEAMHREEAERIAAEYKGYDEATARAIVGLIFAREGCAPHGVDALAKTMLDDTNTLHHAEDWVSQNGPPS